MHLLINLKTNGMKKIMFNDKYGLTQTVLDGRKTQTRRIITCPQTFKGQYVAGFNVYKRVSDGFISEICMYDADERAFEGGQIVPKYRVGEIVAIAQSYKDIFSEFSQHHNPQLNICVKNPTDTAGWTNKMFVKAEVMPHQIRITKVRIEKLQDISDEDCLAEGIYPYYYGDEEEKKRYGIPPNGYSFDGWGFHYPTSREAYAELIDKVGKKGDWQSNPYVFVYEFELIK